MEPWKETDTCERYQKHFFHIERKWGLNTVVCIWDVVGEEVWGFTWQPEQVLASSINKFLIWRGKHEWCEPIDGILLSLEQQRNICWERVRVVRGELQLQNLLRDLNLKRDLIDGAEAIKMGCWGNWMVEYFNWLI